jgi:3-dehydroquinate synthase
LKKVILKLFEEKLCRLYVGENIVNSLSELLKKNSLERFFPVVITSRNLKKIYGEELIKILGEIYSKVCFLSIPVGERSKSLDIFLNVIERIIKMEKKTSIFIISFGGGVVGDLSGFVASIYKRGIPYIQIPTTLLAQVDSSIGGKVAIDLAYGKNLIGSFYQPEFVLIDVKYLNTLPKKEIKTGLSEIVKYGIIKDRAILEILKRENIFKWNCKNWTNLIFKCVKIKSIIVSQDEKDCKDIRIQLNFGHTIGHAIESAANYKLFNHGEAISIGMLVSSYISYLLGMLKIEVFYEIENLIKKLGLKTDIDKKLSVHEIISHIPYDKKAKFGRNRFVLMDDIAKIRIRNDVPLKIIKQALLKFGAK